MRDRRIDQPAAGAQAGGEDFHGCIQAQVGQGGWTIRKAREPDEDRLYAARFDLTISESREHPHNRARGTFVEIDGVAQPRPAPRFSRTDSTIQSPPAAAGEHTDEILRDWCDMSMDEIAALRTEKSIE